MFWKHKSRISIWSSMCVCLFAYIYIYLHIFVYFLFPYLYITFIYYFYLLIFIYCLLFIYLFIYFIVFIYYFYLCVIVIFLLFLFYFYWLALLCLFIRYYFLYHNHKIFSTSPFSIHLHNQEDVLITLYLCCSHALSMETDCTRRSALKSLRAIYRKLSLQIVHKKKNRNNVSAVMR
jgi:hypothetical protein